jgi:hypothetical protein
VIEPLCRELALLQDDLVAQVGVPRANEWIEIYLFADAARYRRYMQRHMSRLPARRALYVKRDGPGMVFAYRGEHFATDLRHETTHALLHASLPTVPLWLDEGLAEYFEVPRESRIDGSEHLAAALRAARRGDTPGLRDLERWDDGAMLRQRDYRAAWSWSHFLLHGPAPARASLRAYVADLSGDQPVVPLSDRLGRQMAVRPRDALLGYFRQAGWQTAQPSDAGVGAGR